jgi:threonine dehydrogenase-like Zn-dependent dehydrogenase
MCKVTFGHDFPVRMSDISPWRLDFARSLGAETIDARDSEALREMHASDVAFDSTGKQIARQAAIAALGKRGVLVCVGHGETLTLDVSPDLIAAERAVMGSEYFRYEELPNNLDLLRDNFDYLSLIITHRVEVEQINEAFASFFAGETGKVVVTQGREW